MNTTAARIDGKLLHRRLGRPVRQLVLPTFNEDSNERDSYETSAELEENAGAMRSIAVGILNDWARRGRKIDGEGVDRVLKAATLRARGFEQVILQSKWVTTWVRPVRREVVQT